MSARQLLNRVWRGYNAALLRLAGRFPSTTILDPYFLYQFHFNRNLAHAAREVNGTLIDIGCGRKPYRGFFAAGRYVGVDLPYYSGGMHDVMPDADVFADATRLPFKEATADAVLAFQVLEHVPDPYAIVAEAHRVLRNEGTLLVTVPQSYPIHGEPHDYYRYTAYGIRHLLERAGFRVEWIRQNGSFGSYVGLMLNKYFFQHFFEFRSTYAARVAFGLLKIVCTPALLAGIAVVNVLGLALDAVHRDPYFTSNYTVVARKDATS